MPESFGRWALDRNGSVVALGEAANFAFLLIPFAFTKQLKAHFSSLFFLSVKRLPGIINFMMPG
jgi:hypothetical protein